MKNENILDIAQKIKRELYPDALIAFAAGSVFRGEGNEYSDIDFVVLYGDGFEDVRRESFMMDGWPVEAFIHNVRAQDYFFDKDREGGSPIMLSMVIEGIEIPGPSEFSRARKAEAQRLFELGPKPMSEDDVRAKRYHISDMLDDLRGQRKASERLGVLSKLYINLADFHLRAAGKWSGNGKGLPRALQRYSPEIAGVYHDAFAEAFSGQGLDKLFSLSEDILNPYGGKLFEYRQAADPGGWKNFQGPA